MRRGEQHSLSKMLSWGFVLLGLLLVLDILSTKGFSSSLYQYWGLEQPERHSLELSNSSVLLCLTVIAYFGINRICDAFIIVNKPSSILASILLIASFIALPFSWSWDTCCVLLILLLILSCLYNIYQEEERTDTYLNIGLLSALLCTLDIQMLYLLPLWLVSGYILDNIGFKVGWAMLTGLVVYSLVYMTCLTAYYSFEHLLPLIETKLNPLSSYHIYLKEPAQHRHLLLYSLLSIVGVLSLRNGRYSESIKQRRQGAVLGLCSIYGIILLSIFSSANIILLVLLTSSIIGARGLQLLRGSVYHIGLILISTIFVLTTILI